MALESPRYFPLALEVLKAKQVDVQSSAKAPSGDAGMIARSQKPAKRPHSRAESFFIVGVGASAGGLEALKLLLGALPPKPGIALVLVQHLDPRHHSLLTEILSKTAKMPIHEAVDNKTVKANCIYVIPPNTSIAIRQRTLHLTPRPSVQAPHLPVDFFFRSLAEDQKSYAIGVILSGNGSDGTAGVAAIKAEGGITFSQDEGSAKFDGMPHSAIASGNVDLVLPPAEIAAELVRVAQHAPRLEQVENEGLPAASHGELGRIFSELQNVVGVDFSQYKLPTILRRVQRRMALLKIGKIDDYAKHLHQHSEETQKLYADLLINVTGFFRDPEAYKALCKRALPRVLKERAADAALRIWGPGCSTGEETYSLAISALECVEKTGSSIPIQVFGTDISDAALEKARKGIYPESIVEDVSRERLRRFFTKVEGGYQVGKQVRDICVFARHNLFNDPPFSRMDLVCCRNVLIYLGPALQKKVIPMLHYALRPGGFLLLGNSEGVSGFSHLFESVDKKQRLFAHKPGDDHHLDFGRHLLTAQLSRAGARAGTETSEGESAVQKEADRIVLLNYAPAGVVIGSNMNVLSFRGRTHRYLEPAPGKASLNVLRMAKPGLSGSLQIAINEAKKTNQIVRKNHIPLQFDGEAGFLDIEVFPIRPASPGDRCFLILFEEVEAHKIKPELVPTGRRRSKSVEGSVIVHLKAQLGASQDALRDAIEAHEGADEELRSANEEVLSANEELQSTNEELETSKEEMQSANEEMTTLNDELRHRNHELGLLNSDLVNLLSTINMPILMIGSDLRIRRLTPSADKVFNIIASDIGRPITDIRSKIDVADLEEAILHVIESLTTTIREVRDAQGQWYSLEIRPYRTVDNKIDGVVLALVDIDQQKRAAEMDKKAKEFSDAIIDTVRQPFLVLDSRLRVVRANEAFYQAFQVDPEKTERKPVYELGDGQWNIPALRRLLEEVLPKSQEVRDLEVEREFEGIGRRAMLLNARRVNAFSDSHEALILLAIDDITERKRRGEGDREHMEEMDRSNRAMVDRELRMIELKKEVNEMLQQKGETARYPLGFDRGEEESSGSPRPGSNYE